MDLLTGHVLDTGKGLAWSNGKEYHHFFPDDYLKGIGLEPKRINCLANFIMLISTTNKRISNRAPSDYLKEVAKAAAGNLDKWLASNLIPNDAFELALVDDFERFVARRSAHLQSTVMALC